MKKDHQQWKDDARRERRKIINSGKMRSE